MRFRAFVMQRDLQEGAKLAAVGRAGATHQRLQGVLKKMAEEDGFTMSFDLGSDPEGILNPDVCGRNEAGIIFVGEAKDGEHEPASNAHSRWRVGRYLRALAGLIHAGKVPGGVFVLATNSPSAARGWSRELSLLSVERELHWDDGGGFTISGSDETWFVW